MSVRMPAALARRASRLVKQIGDERILTPGVRLPVRASIAVLAVRGLEVQIKTLEDSIKRRRLARAECQRLDLQATTDDGSVFAPKEADNEMGK